jgi:hypothetical protein
MKEKIIDRYIIDGYGEDEVIFLQTEKNYYQLSWALPDDIPENELDYVTELTIGNEFDPDDIYEFECLSCEEIDKETFESERGDGEDEYAGMYDNDDNTPEETLYIDNVFSDKSQFEISLNNEKNENKANFNYRYEYIFESDYLNDYANSDEAIDDVSLEILSDVKDWIKYLESKFTIKNENEIIRKIVDTMLTTIALKIENVFAKKQI